jgi:hypothetical protein
VLKMSKDHSTKAQTAVVVVYASTSQ